MSGEIQHERLTDQVYEHLKRRILSQRLLPGDRLSVPAVARDLQLSRSPVREAVQRLVQEGLATERARHGAVVATADVDSLIHLYEVRAALEGLSAALAAAGTATVRTGTADTDALAGELREIHSGHQEAYRQREHADVIRADIAFHERILLAAGNPELQRTLAPILQRMAIAMLAGNPELWPARALPEHEAVIDAIERRDPDTARLTMQAHVHRVRSDLIDTRQADPGSGNPPREP